MIFKLPKLTGLPGTPRKLISNKTLSNKTRTKIAANKNANRFKILILTNLATTKKVANDNEPSIPNKAMIQAVGPKKEPPATRSISK